MEEEWEIQGENLFEELDQGTEPKSPEQAVKDFLSDSEDDDVEGAEGEDKDTPKKPVKSVEEKGVNLFDELDKKVDEEEEEEEDEDDDDDESKSKKDSNEKLNSIRTLNTLVSKGLLDLGEELEELPENITEEEAEEIIEAGFESALDKRLEERISDFPSDAKKLLKFLHNGGTITDYIYQVASSMGPDISLKEDMDLEDEKVQENVVRALLAEEFEDEEDLEAEIELYKDSGRLKNVASRLHKRWLKTKEEREQDLIEKQKEQRLTLEKQHKEKKTAMQKLISDENSLGIPAPKNKANTLPSYVYDKVEKLKNGTVITKMQKELFYDIPENPVAYAQLAVLLQYRKEDGTFDLDVFKTSAETKVTKTLKDTIRRTNTSKPAKKKPRYLADMFSE